MVWQQSKFKRRTHDKYLTWDKRAYPPLIVHLEPGCTFVEPCAGRGDIVINLEELGFQCRHCIDIKPQIPWVQKADAMELLLCMGDYIITNPPYTKQVMHPMIDHLRRLAPTWMLLEADWMHTQQAMPYMKFCAKVVSVGKLKWIEDSKHDSQKNYAWYLFVDIEVVTRFYGRIPR